MTHRPLFRLEDAKGIAETLVTLLSCACEEILIVGSVRREKKYVSDVEILFRPKLIEGKVEDLFDPPEPVHATDVVLENLLEAANISKRANSAGVYTWGPLNKLARHCTGLPVDLFCEPNAADWARSVVIRTGPKELNIRLIQGAERQGLAMHAYGAGFTKLTTGEVVPCQSEREVFFLCGIPWLEPNERTNETRL